MPIVEREYKTDERLTRIEVNLLSKEVGATPHFKREMNYFLIPSALPM
jgi:hypothetical protein